MRRLSVGMAVAAVLLTTASASAAPAPSGAGLSRVEADQPAGFGFSTPESVSAALSAVPAKEPDDDGWTPIPSKPAEYEAGVLCDFPIRTEPVVDEVMAKVLERHPDGESKREAYTGDLVVKVTNRDTGKSVKVGASGEGFGEIADDGSMTWYAKGATLVSWRDNGGNVPRGLWHLDGLYTVDFAAAPDQTRILRSGYGSKHNVCTDLD